jgi:hypothetical protein
LRILWLSVAPIEDDNGHLISTVASARTRIIAAARGLRELGHDYRFVNPGHSLQRATQLLQDVDAVVFAKPFRAAETGDFSVVLAAYRELYDRLPAGIRVVIDVGEGFFDTPEIAAISLRQSATIVAPSLHMADLLAARHGIRAHVIPDCLEGPGNDAASPLPTRSPRLFRLLDRLVTRRAGRWRASILWTGSRTDVPALRAALPELARASRWFPLHLTCLGWDDAGLEGLGAECVRLGADVTLLSLAAGPQAFWRALRACDLVWLPHATDDDRARARGAGPLAEALHGGRFVVASAVPAYVEFAEHAWIGDATGDGLLWALRHPVEAAGRIQRGQALVRASRSQPAIALQWQAALEAAAQAPERRPIQ